MRPAAAAVQKSDRSYWWLAWSLLPTIAAAPPKRVTRPDGAVLPFARDLDLALQPTRGQLREAIETVAKSR